MAKKEHPEWGFTYLDNFSGKIKCDHCGEVLPGGILSQMEHISKCDGHKPKMATLEGPDLEYFESIAKVLSKQSKT